MHQVRHPLRKALKKRATDVSSETANKEDRCLNIRVAFGKLTCSYTKSLKKLENTKVKTMASEFRGNKYRNRKT